MEENKFEGVYKFVATYLMQKTYQIFKDFAETGSFSVSALANPLVNAVPTWIIKRFMIHGHTKFALTVKLGHETSLVQFSNSFFFPKVIEPLFLIPPSLITLLSSFNSPCPYNPSLPNAFPNFQSLLV